MSKYEKFPQLKPSVPYAPNWRLSNFEKRLREIEGSYKVWNSVKKSGRGFLSLSEAGTSVNSHLLSQFQIITTLILTKFTIFYFESGWRETERSSNPVTVVIQVSNYEREPKVGHFHTIAKTIGPLSLAQSVLKVDNGETGDIYCISFEWWEYVWFERCFSFN